MNNGLSLEFPVTIKRAGKPDVMGILEYLTASECRFRSLVAFERDEAVQLRLSITGGPRIEASGRILSTTISGTRHYHDVAIDPMSAEHSDAFVSSIADISARHSERRVLPEVPATKGLVRSSVRIALHEDVRFAASRAAGTGTATNISTGGMLMAAMERIDVGEAIELRFALERGPENFVRGRIVAFHSGSVGVHQYNIAFFGVDEAVRDRIAAYVSSRASGNVAAHVSQP